MYFTPGFLAMTGVGVITELYLRSYISDLPLRQVQMDSNLLIQAEAAQKHTVPGVPSWVPDLDSTIIHRQLLAMCVTLVSITPR